MQLVSETDKYVTLKSSPAHLWTSRAAAALGAGDYRIDTSLDGKVIATNKFRISATPSAALFDKDVAAKVCKAPSNPKKQANSVALARAFPEHPPRAAESNVAGCAVVLLTIDQTGHPNAVQVVADYPPGFGFGEAVKMAALRTAYPSGYDGWSRYMTVTFKPPNS